MTVWIKRQELTIYCLQETYFKYKDKDKEVKRMQKDYENISCFKTGKGIINIKQNRVQTKPGILTKIKRDIYLHKRINLARRYNKSKCLYTS